MDLEQKKYELISDYIRGNLEEGEKRSFEHKMKLDEGFYKEVQLHKNIYVSQSEEGWIDLDHTNNQSDIERIKNIRRSSEIHNLESIINHVSDDYLKINKKTNYRKYLIPLTAATIGCFFLLRTLFTPSISELYDIHVNWEQNLISKIEQTASKNSSSQEGELLFKKGEYRKAKTVFLNIINENKNPNSHSLMYLGASHLELEEYDKALLIFDQLLTQNTLDSNRAHWFKTLVYLKKSDKDKAVKELKVLTGNPKNYKYDIALKILNELE